MATGLKSWSVWLERMLEPEAAKRISMREVADALTRLERPSALTQIWLASVLAAAATLAAGLFVTLWLNPGVLPEWLGGWRDQVNLSHLTIRPLASQPGLEDNPSISPDGLWVSCLYRARAVRSPEVAGAFHQRRPTGCDRHRQAGGARTGGMVTRLG